MKRRWSWALAAWLMVLVFSASTTDAAGPERTDLSLATLRFQNLSLEDGLSQSVVLAITQDLRGFMWFATEDGLNRYDGYAFAVYRHDPDDAASLANNYVRALQVDRHGTLWVGTDSGLNRYDPATDGFIHYAPDPADASSLGGKEVHALAEDSAGGIWVGTADGGLSRLDPTSGTFVRYRHAALTGPSLSDDYVSALLVDRDQTLWIGTNRGLDRLDLATNVITRIPVLAHGDGAVRALCRDSGGQLWVGLEEQGLVVLDPATDTSRHFLHREDDLSTLSGNTVWAIYEDEAGRMWVGTQGGLSLWDAARGHFVRFGHNSSDSRSLAADTIRSISQDQSGVVWFGTYGAGLSKLTRTVDRFTLYRHDPENPNSLSEDAIWSVATTPDGSVWAGTMREGLNRMDRAAGTVTGYRHDPNDPESLGHNDVRTLLVDATGSLWIGTYGGGLARLDPETGVFTHYRHDPADADSLSENLIRMLHQDRAGALWIATQASGLDRLDPATGIFAHYRHDSSDPASLSSDRVRSILEGRDGRIWLGTWNAGLNALDPATGRVIRYRHDPDDPQSLSNDTVLALAEDRQGTLWVGTYGGGLARYDATTDTFRSYTQRHGLPNDGIYGILEDAQGHLWLSTNVGLSRFDPRSETFRNYDVSDGLQSNEFHYGAAHQSAWGELFIGGIDGLNAFYPERVKNSPYVPPVIITTVRRGNETLRTNLAPDEELMLSHADRHISFEFTALDYNAPEVQRYAYMMEGQDREWLDAGNRRHADYTNLRGGRYVFRVIAANSDGVWDETGAAVHLTITPPLWDRWPFRAAMVALLAGILFSAYRWRLSAVETRNRMLEERIAERTSEIERRRRAAEGLGDILAVLNSDRGLGETLEHIARQAQSLLGTQAAAIYRVDHGDLALHVEVALGDPALLNRQARVALDQGSLATFVRTREPVTIPRHDALAQGDSALLAVPVVVKDQVYGAMALHFDGPRELTEEHVRLAETLAGHAALAIENARLRMQAEQAAVSSERNRIARELHDSVSQALYGIALGARTLGTLVERQPLDKQVKDTLRNPLTYVLSLADAGLAEMRALIFELRPDALEKEGLVAALTKQAEAMRARQNLEVHTDFCDEPVDLPLEAKEALYRVAQEALNNLIKHAQARRVDLSLRCTPNSLELEVRDDGIGFDAHADYPGHLGLQTMRERVERLGGRLDIQSVPGNGTTVRALLGWAQPEMEAS